jgi:hypothetical protein
LKRQKIKLLRANLRTLFSRDGPSRRASAYALDDPPSDYPPVGTVTQRGFLTAANWRRSVLDWVDALTAVRGTEKE